MRRTAPPATGWGARAWQRLSLLLGGVTVAAVAFSVVMLVQRPNQPGSAIASVQMAALLHGKGGQSAVVTVHNGAPILTAVGAMSAPGGKSYQRWPRLRRASRCRSGWLSQVRRGTPLPLQRWRIWRRPRRLP